MTPEQQTTVDAYLGAVALMAAALQVEEGTLENEYLRREAEALDELLDPSSITFVVAATMQRLFWELEARGYSVREAFKALCRYDAHPPFWPSLLELHEEQQVLQDDVETLTARKEALWATLSPAYRGRKTLQEAAFSTALLLKRAQEEEASAGGAWEASSLLTEASRQILEAAGRI